MFFIVRKYSFMLKLIIAACTRVVYELLCVKFMFIPPLKKCIYYALELLSLSNINIDVNYQTICVIR